jgi:elongator complex protein 5
VYTFLSTLLALLRSRPSSRLVIHTNGLTTLHALLSTTRFSPSLLSVAAYPIAILDHLASSYLTLPPPLSAPAKFWRVFLPLAERQHDVVRLVFDRDGEGSNGSSDFVIEVLVRGGDGPSRRSGSAQRELAGWSANGPCDLNALKAIQHLFTKTTPKEEVCISRFVACDCQTHVYNRLPWTRRRTFPSILISRLPNNNHGPRCHFHTHTKVNNSVLHPPTAL